MDIDLLLPAFLENGDEVKDVPYFIDRLEILPKASSKRKNKNNIYAIANKKKVAYAGFFIFQ